jgi:site-specific DNA-methyltransferase (adenine-specific)
MVDAVISDPPYGISYSPAGGGGGIRSKNGKRYEKTFHGNDLVIGDNQPFDPAHLLNLAPIVVLWGGNHFASRLPDSPGWLLWDKRCGTSQNDFADCEMAWSNVKAPARCINHLWNGMLKDSERGEKRVHPTQKPIEVMKWSIETRAPKAEVILDPYMGSGTTGVAAVMLGRSFIGMEISEEHFTIACRRVEQAYRQTDLFIKQPEKMTQGEML